MRSDKYTFFFAAAVCIICSVLLAIAASSLRPLQEKNALIDRKKNILKALSLYNADNGKPTDEQIMSTYKSMVKEIVINQEGQQVEKSVEEVLTDPSLHVVYMRTSDSAFAFPVKGMGLWSLLQGYFALENDAKTVLGITFYSQKETPGLGAEIEANWFTSQFVGKEIKNSKGELVGIKVAKGKAADDNSAELNNTVDGISGATITGRGVSDLLTKGVQTYRPFLEKIWQKEG